MKDSSRNRGVMVLGSMGILALLQSAQAAPSYQLPLTFEINEGQTDDRVGFLAHGPGYNIFLTATEAVLAWPRAQAAGDERPVVRMQLVGGAADPEMRGLDELPGTVNYFHGRDAASWQTRIRTYGRVEYSKVYPGIDLVYYGQRQQLEYDFIVAPGADPGTIELGFVGVEQSTVDARGDLVLKMADGSLLRFQKPVIFQTDGRGRRHTVEGGYVHRSPHHIGFRVHAYDRTRPLIIDPVLSYSTYLGGSGSDFGSGIAVDATGAVYVTGFTTSADFPTANALQPARNGGGYDLYVAKLTPDGTALVYATYLGGSSDEFGADIAVDSAGAAYVTSSSSSSDFPTMHALQPVNRSGRTAVVTKLSADGSRLIYSTYLGGSGGEFGTSIAVDLAGAAYIAGTTGSLDFPLVNAVQPALLGESTDAFVAKIAPDGSALQYSTYLGGTLGDDARDIAVDSLGAAYVVGVTEGEGFPSVNPLPGPGGGFDAFVVKFAPDGTRLIYSSLLGGNTDDGGSGIAVDDSGAAYVTGYTHSSDFPTTNALQKRLLGTTDAFVVKIAPEGGAILYGTFLGGLDDDFGYGIAVDTSGAAHVTGSTVSTDFPTMNPIQGTLHGLRDVFVSTLSPDGASLVQSTYLGGREDDLGIGIAVNLTGATYLTGQTRSHNFPTTASMQPVCSGGNSDAFVVKIAGDSSALAGAGVAGPATDESITASRERNGGGGAMDALFVAVLALLAVAGALRRRERSSWSRGLVVLAWIGVLGLLSSAQAALGAEGDNDLENFNDLDGAFVVTNGEARRSDHEGMYTEDRHYLTTARSDYLLSDWVYEVTVRSPTDGPPDILYIGVGSGRPDPTYSNEPANSLMFRIHQGWIGGRVDVAAHPTGPAVFTYFAEAIGFLPAHSGTTFTEFTARIAKVGNTIEFRICKCPSDSEPCEPEFSDEILDLSAAAPFLSSGNTYLFLGNGSGSYVFARATVSPGPATAGISDSSNGRMADNGGSSIDALGRSGGGAMDASFVVVLALLALAAVIRRSNGLRHRDVAHIREILRCA